MIEKLNIVRYFPGMRIPHTWEVNILSGKWEPADIVRFFEPIVTTYDVFIVVPRDMTWGAIFVAMGLFESVEEAARGGWDSEIDDGFESFRVGDPSRWVTSFKGK